MKTVARDIDQQAGEVDSAAAFVAFVRALARDLERDREAWENVDLPSYLSALARWVEDMDGYYAGRGEPVPSEPTWRMLADMLMAASMYE